MNQIPQGCKKPGGSRIPGNHFVATLIVIVVLIVLVLLFVATRIAFADEERWAYSDSTITILAFDTVSHHGKDKSPEETQNLLYGFAGYRYMKTWGKAPAPQQMLLLPLFVNSKREAKRETLVGRIDRGGVTYSSGRWYAADDENQFEPWIEESESKRLLIFPMKGVLQPADVLTVIIGEVEYVLKTVEEIPQ